MPISGIIFLSFWMKEVMAKPKSVMMLAHVPTLRILIMAAGQLPGRDGRQKMRLRTFPDSGVILCCAAVCEAVRITIQMSCFGFCCCWDESKKCLDMQSY